MARKKTVVEEPKMAAAEIPEQENNPDSGTPPPTDAPAADLPTPPESPPETENGGPEGEGPAEQKQMDPAVDGDAGKPPVDPDESEREILFVGKSVPDEPPDPDDVRPPDEEEPEPPLPAELEEPPADPPPEKKKSERQMFFETDFNMLDRDLTPEERQEWNSIYASYRGHSALSGKIVGVDRRAVCVRNKETGEYGWEYMFSATVMLYRIPIIITADEMWEKGQERPNFAFKNTVGATIEFIVTRVDREGEFVMGSRRLAMRSQRYYFAHKPALNQKGTRIKCQVMSVGPRRCWVECYGHDFDFTQRELRYTAIPDLRDEYHSGQELDCIVKHYNPEADKLIISVKEAEPNPYDGAELRHPVGCHRQTVISGKYGGGVFCNLPDGTVCMCNYSYQFEDSDFMVGDTVIIVVQRFDREKRQMYGKIIGKW